MINSTQPLCMGANVTIITKTKGIHFNATNINGLLQKISETNFDILVKEKYKHNVFFDALLRKEKKQQKLYIYFPCKKNFILKIPTKRKYIYKKKIELRGSRWRFFK